MGLSFTIGGATFNALGSGTGSFALAFDADSPQQEIKRFHVPGGDGNYILRGGRAGVRITARFRYVDTVDNVYAAFESNKSAWANVAVEITGPGGADYQRCSLQPGSMRIIRQPQAKGDAANVWMDCEARFISDA
jgi:hypothetical protein